MDMNNGMENVFRVRIGKIQMNIYTICYVVDDFNGHFFCHSLYKII